MNKLFETLGVKNEEEALQVIAGMAIAPVTVTLTWTPLSGVGMSVMGTDNDDLVEQILNGAIKEVWKQQIKKAED